MVELVLSIKAASAALHTGMDAFLWRYGITDIKNTLGGICKREGPF